MSLKWKRATWNLFIGTIATAFAVGLLVLLFLGLRQLEMFNEYLTQNSGDNTTIVVTVICDCCDYEAVCTVPTRTPTPCPTLEETCECECPTNTPSASGTPTAEVTPTPYDTPSTATSTLVQSPTPSKVVTSTVTPTDVPLSTPTFTATVAPTKTAIPPICHVSNKGKDGNWNIIETTKHNPSPGHLAHLDITKFCPPDYWGICDGRYANMSQEDLNNLCRIVK